jgi:ribosome-associated heat shock protein Hsp15
MDSGGMDSGLAAMRIDKWLWAARFFKTRSLASAAAAAGRIVVNGNPAKPAKEIRVGDLLDLRIGDLRWRVSVRGLSGGRGPASQAALLYEEEENSRREREAALMQRRLATEPAAAVHGRPTKRDRRRMQRFFG